MSVVNRHPICETVKTFTLQPRGNHPHTLPDNIKNFYPDLMMVGKHYLVQELNAKGVLTGQAR